MSVYCPNSKFDSVYEPLESVVAEYSPMSVDTVAPSIPAPVVVS